MTEALRTILVVDDEAPMRHMLGLVLTKQGFRVTEAVHGREALRLLDQRRFDLVLCDIRMPEMNGLAVMQEISRRDRPPLVIMMSAYGTIDTAVECMKLGAYDYISKPFRPDEIVMTLRKALEKLNLETENRQLKGALAGGGERFSLDDIVYASRAMGALLADLAKVAVSDSPVLISGETGTGKELVAKALHSESHRADGPFLAVNCSTISAGLLESELFGHVKGSFTGADRNKQGIFAAASGGTLFLDEISELPLELQPKLLRVLQEGEIRPVGSNTSIAVDTRVVAASGVDWQDLLAGNRFRSDLYYRLAVVEMKLPPLRERPDDIPVLSRHFLAEIASREGIPTPLLDTGSAKRLQEYSWPGNVRELRNYLEKAMIFSRHGELELPPLAVETRRHSRDDDYSLKVATRRLEEEYLRKALVKTEGNRTRAAQLLEISLRSLMYKIKEYGLEDIG